MDKENNIKENLEKFCYLIINCMENSLPETFLLSNDEYKNVKNYQSIINNSSIDLFIKQYQHFFEKHHKTLLGMNINRIISKNIILKLLENNITIEQENKIKKYEINISDVMKLIKDNKTNKKLLMYLYRSIYYVCEDDEDLELIESCLTKLEKELNVSSELTNSNSNNDSNNFSFFDKMKESKEFKSISKFLKSNFDLDLENENFNPMDMLEPEKNKEFQNIVNNIDKEKIAKLADSYLGKGFSEKILNATKELSQNYDGSEFNQETISKLSNEIKNMKDDYTKNIIGNKNDDDTKMMKYDE